MFRKYAFLMVFFLGGTCVWAQVKETTIAPTRTPLSEVEKIVMPAVDNQLLLEEEMNRRAPGLAPRFAKAFEVDITPQTHGHWETLPDGRAVWRLRIFSKNAFSLNLGFSNYHMPKEGKMVLYSPDQKNIMGPFSRADNEEHAQLWTPIFEGDELVLEVSLPGRLKSALGLRLEAVNHDFLNFAKTAASGSCNLDVVCGETDGWEINDKYRDAIQSVGIYGFGGTNFCTGFLVNNTRNDCTPYFITAYHCGVTTNNAPSVVVYWNYQNSNCRPPSSSSSGNPGNGSLRELNMGSKLIATYRKSDFTLLELDDDVAESANAYFAGWSRNPIPPKDTVVCVHHPNSSEKRISYSFQPTYMGSWESEDIPVPNGDHIVVPRWDIGTTEVGSSGGPLLNKEGKVVGQLHGGFADCNNAFYDSFGAFSVSWTGGRSNFSSLGAHLDPLENNPMSIEGRSQRVCSYSLNPEVLSQEVCLPDSAVFSFRLSENFSSQVQLSVEGLPDGMQARFDHNPATAGQQVRLTITAALTVKTGLYPFTVFAQSGEESVFADFELRASNGIPLQSELIAPADQMGDAPNVVNFEWEKQKEFSSYHLQVSLDSLFEELVADITLIDTNYFQYEVAPQQRYYWRIRAENICGNSAWSAIRTFRTADVACNLHTAQGLPKIIDNNGTSKITSTIELTNPGQIIKVAIKDLEIEHSFIGDLKGSLTSPSGQSVRLFDRIGSPDIIFGCDGDNMMVSFSDEAGQTADQLEGVCGSNPAVEGSFQPIDPFSNLVGEQAEGKWTLTLEDISNQDGGQLNAWKLEICSTQPKGITLTPSVPELEVCVNQKASFNLFVGPGFDSTGTTLSYQGLPEGATLVFSQNPALPGSTIAINIEGITDAGEFPLEITASDDEFKFSAQIPLRVVNPPGLPEIESPDFNALLLTSTPTLSWTASAEASNYKLEISTDDQFSDTVLVSEMEENTITLAEPLSPGLYYWRVTARNACGASTTATSVFEISTTDVDTPAVSEVKIYPNPARDQLTLDLGQGSFQDIQWRIRSTNGQILLQGQQSRAPISTIDISRIPEGLFLLEIRSTEFFITEKIVKH